MSASEVAMGQLAERFATFARLEATGVSPLYAELAQAVSRSQELLGIASCVLPGQPPPNMLLGAVHYLLLSGVQHPLRAFYPSLGGTEPPSDAFPSFREFCWTHRPEIEAILRERRVQTNEVARCSILLPGFAVVQRRSGTSPWTLFDVGASAGLHLLWDRYAYDFGGGQAWGPRESPLTLMCEVRGNATVPLPSPELRVESRSGIDLNPLDVSNPEDRLWLRSLIWPEQRERASRLERAIEVLREEPPRLIRGDVLTVLPHLLEDVPPRNTVCIFSAFTLNQLPPEGRRRFSDMLEEHDRARPVHLLTLGYATEQDVELRLTTYDGGTPAEKRLARCAPHGGWIEWLGADP